MSRLGVGLLPVSVLLREVVVDPVGGGARLVDDDRAERDDGRDDHRGEASSTRCATARPRGIADAVEVAHERVQQERDHAPR